MAALARLADARNAISTAVWIESRLPWNEFLLSPEAVIQFTQIQGNHTEAVIQFTQIQGNHTAAYGQKRTFP
jgi:hypothetical protein